MAATYQLGYRIAISGRGCRRALFGRIHFVGRDLPAIMAAFMSGRYRNRSDDRGAGSHARRSSPRPEPRRTCNDSSWRARHLAAGLPVPAAGLGSGSPARGQPLRRVLRQRNGRMALMILLFIGVYRISDITIGLMASTLYCRSRIHQERGRGPWSKSFGFLAMTILGAFAGGILVARLRHHAAPGGSPRFMIAATNSGASPCSPLVRARDDPCSRSPSVADNITVPASPEPYSSPISPA